MTGYCPGVTGAYSETWSADCSMVSLHVVTDTCTQRSMIVDGNTLTRQ
jgi:hypothetical protein